MKTERQVTLTIDADGFTKLECGLIRAAAERSVRELLQLLGHSAWKEEVLVNLIVPSQPSRDS